MGFVYKFDPIDEKIKRCRDLALTDRFLMGMGINDGAKQVATLGEKKLHLFDGNTWKTVDREEQPRRINSV